MATKTVCVHRYEIPPLGEFSKKWYFLVASLLFEYEAGGYYRDDLEIFGFNEAQSTLLCGIFPDFYQEDKAIKIEDFTYSRLEKMISILPEDEKKLLIDHIILSSIDKSSDLQELSYNLKINLYKVSNSVPLQDFSKLDFYKFFRGGESSFMNEYYPSEEAKDEIRVQYGLKYRGLINKEIIDL